MDLVVGESRRSRLGLVRSGAIHKAVVAARTALLGVIALLAAGGSLPLLSSPIAVNVPGRSNPWLAGMPDGTATGFGDVAPLDSPVQVPLVLAPGTMLTFSPVTGGVHNTPNCPWTCSPPDGDYFTSHVPGDQFGIAGLVAPLNALLGVFLDSTQPDLTPAPVSLDFSVIGLDFTTLYPLLKQPFFIGDGMTSGAVVQQFFAPADATRLYLGTLDGYGWFNNSGSFDVTVNATVTEPPTWGAIPEPSTWALVGGGLLWLVARRRRTGDSV